MRILSVVGARPQFVKLAPIAHAMTSAGIEHVVVHTGQHYDKNMSDVFFTDLGISRPQVELAVGSASHGRQTGAMLSAMDEVLERYQPDWVVVYGDTNSTIAGALAATKLHIPTAHVEAGLRSFNRRMPEELNRVATDHLSDLCLAPTEVAMKHLSGEGLANRSVLVGDVMTDVLLSVREDVRDKPNPVAFAVGGEYRLATLHRADNTDDPATLQAIIESFGALDLPTVLLAHPRLRSRAADYGIELETGSIVVMEPLPYPQLVRALIGANGVITDSGGLQKEAFILRVPCTTVRTETEWTETLECGWNVLATPDACAIAKAVRRERPASTRATPYGDGGAAGRVVAAILRQ